MCGIAGLLGPLNPQNAQARLQSMLLAQAHRGPDGQGLEVLRSGESVVCLGNRRLAILDLSPLGRQPMVNPDTGDVLVYNGELYNFMELRSRLETAGHTFRSRSDTEVLLRAYQEWGVRCLDLLRGMFAFAVWDARRSRLVLARDHLGIKPLYYSSTSGRNLLFASEIRSLLASSLLDPQIDRQGLAGFLAYGAVQEPYSIFRGIVPLPPASYAEFNPQGALVQSGVYWHMPNPAWPSSGRDRQAALTEEGKTLLRQSVKRHLVSDVPVGVFHSAGLDSTAVLGLAVQQSGNNVQSFTVTFPDQQAVNEERVANQAARHNGVTSRNCPVDGATALDWAKEWFTHLDQPTMDGMNTYIISKALHAQGLKVALSGQGGDEIFGGYPSFTRVPKLYRAMRAARYLPRTARVGLVKIATRTSNGVTKAKAVAIAAGDPSVADIYFQQRRLLSDQDLDSLGVSFSSLGLSPAYHNANSRRENPHLVPDDPVATVQRLETAYYLGNTLLRDGDVFSMANSLEVRVPFLDRDLVDWAMRLPGKVLLPHGTKGKHLLREACREFFTEEQLDRPKSGFTLPIAPWLLGPLRETMDAGLEQVVKAHLLDPVGVDRIRQAFLREPQSPAWSRVWALVVLGHWLNTHKRSPAYAS